MTILTDQMANAKFVPTEYKALYLLPVLQKIGQRNNFYPVAIAKEIKRVDPYATVRIEDNSTLFIWVKESKRLAMCVALHRTHPDEISLGAGKMHGWIRVWWD